jgi:hypothetical protein
VNCCRQAGKSTVVAFLSLVEALYNPGTLVLLLSRSLRQSTELFRRVSDFHYRLGNKLLERKNRHEMTLVSGSRIISLPCQPDTVRGFSKVHVLVIDEAARVPDDLYRAVRPMLAVSRGRLICLSTPYGKRGFFYDAWANGGAEWTRIEVPAALVPRITPDFLAQERKIGESYYCQEYECSFEALEGLVYPDFARCVVPAPRSLPRSGQGEGGLHPATGGGSAWDLLPPGKKVGGIDFGYRNPFAAIWGIFDRDYVLWLVGEHYLAQQPLSYHLTRLPQGVTWYADPSGAGDIATMRGSGFVVRPGDNSVRAGIAVVSARLAEGRIKIVQGCCPNLLAEAALYRYGDDRESRKSETPDHGPDHALDALRYLATRLWGTRPPRNSAPPPTGPDGSPTQTPPKPTRRPWLRYDNEALWTRIF